MSDRPAADSEFTAPATPDEHSSESRGRANVIRTRVIPALAGLLLLGIIGMIAWSMFAPESARSDVSERLGNAIVYKDSKPASDFTLAYLNRDGEDFQLSEMQGKTVVLNFWASWCGPCRSEMPVLKQASKDLAGENIAIIGVNTLDDRPAAEDFIDELGIEYPNVIDAGTGEVAVDYGVTGVPETFVVGPNGNLVARLVGTVDNVQDVRELAALAQ